MLDNIEIMKNYINYKSQCFFCDGVCFLISVLTILFGYLLSLILTQSYFID